MSCDQRYVGVLVFATPAALERAVKALRDGPDGDCFADAALEPGDLVADGAILRVSIAGSFPASAWDTTTSLLEMLAGGARSGTIEATYDPGDGAEPLLETIVAGAANRWRPDDDDVVTILHRNDLEAIRGLLARGALPDALLAEASTSKAEVVELLIAAGADPNGAAVTPGEPPRRPLRSAAQSGSTSAVRALLAAGADPDLLDGDLLVAATPLHMAASHGHLPVVRLLLKRGARLDLGRPNGGATPLHEAAASDARDRRKVVELLVKAGAPIEARDARGRTPLALARESQHVDVVDRWAGAAECARRPDTSADGPAGSTRPSCERPR